MDYVIPKEVYEGRVNEVVIGTGSSAVTVGGDDSYSFHFFEGTLPNPPKFGLEIYDLEPTDWSPWAIEPFADVASSPPRWAKKCVDAYGAEVICFQLASTDPFQADSPPGQAAAQTRAVVEAVDVPVLVYGTGNERKDAEVLTRVAKECAGKNLFLGPVLEKNLDEIAKAALDYGHGVILRTPLEHGMAREMNIRLTKTLTPDRILCDPTSLAVGYGIEFSFTVMQRFQQGAMLVNDVNLQMPLIANLGKECWAVQEARKSKSQGIAWETISGMSLLLAGANLIVLRHPETYRILKDLTSRR